jgi:dUTP pyrophosphatase
LIIEVQSDNIDDMNIKLLSDKGKMPTKGSVDAAGYDLYTTESYELKIGERKTFKTDISLAIPQGLYGRVAPRSGLAVKKGLDVLAGVIDADYRGEILVALINLGQENVIINSGDKIAQIIFEHYTNHEFNVVDDLNSTDRGDKGFGSTDKVSESKTPKIPEAVESFLENMYKKNPIEINNQTRYIDGIKEREKNI